jgi:Zn-dependent M28 family amino/carboxypeptidase
VFTRFPSRSENKSAKLRGKCVLPRKIVKQTEKRDRLPRGILHLLDRYLSMESIPNVSILSLPKSIKALQAIKPLKPAIKIGLMN